MPYMAKYQSSAGDTTRMLSPGIWGNCPLEEIQKYKTGVFDFEDFYAFNIGSTGTAHSGREIVLTNSTIAPADEIGGVAVFTNGDTDNDEAIIGPNFGAFKITKGNGMPLWFECRLKEAGVADANTNTFVGLIEPAIATDIPITDSNALADKNMIGWARLASDGDTFEPQYKADGQTAQIVLADAVTPVAATYLKLGMYFDGKETVKFYKDGLFVTGASIGATALDAVTFPSDICLGWVVATKSDNATTANMSIDWIAVAQSFVS